MNLQTTVKDCGDRFPQTMSFPALLIILAAWLGFLSLDSLAHNSEQHKAISKKPVSKANASVNRKMAGEMWGENYFPNIELTTHDGKKLRFFDDVIKDKVVAINFIFTTCEDICPAETARLKSVADILGERMGKDVFFYSITIDPGNDTPEVLNAYS